MSKEVFIFPLSFAQQRLWFLDQLTPANPFYNIFTTLSYDFPLDPAALEWSINEVVHRHETLRTTFTSVNGQPFQVIAPSLHIPLPVTDLSHLSPTEREAEAQRLASAEALQPFDLANGPLVRTQLVRLSAEDHVFLVTVHHIISDGWSMDVLFRELSVLYEAYVEGWKSPLPELTLQYADYAAWQHEWLSGARLEEQVSYWRNQLAEPEVLQLPTDWTRPSVLSYRGAGHALELPSDLSASLSKLSRQEGATLFMTLLAAYMILLSRYSGQEDITVGSPIANRGRTEVEGLIGFFVNTLVLRGDLRGEPSFVELLSRVREMCFGAYAHQDLPFEKLVEELQPQRDLSRSPLFQTTIQLQNITSLQYRSDGYGFNVKRQTANFDLSLDLKEYLDGITAYFEYSTELFEAATIERLAQHFFILLESIVAEPTQPITRLELLPPAEREQLLVEWNQTAAAYPSQCIHQLFARQAAATPNAVALTHHDDQVSYQELEQRANQLARFLQQRGVGPETLVGVLMERSVDMVVAFLAVLKAGGAYVTMDPELPNARLRYMVAEAGVRVLLSRGQEAEAIEAPGVELVQLDAQRDQIKQESTEEIASAVELDNLAYVIYTSGSTGKPKGVGVSHRALINHNAAVARAYDMRPDDRVLQFASPSFDMAAEEIFPALLNGATVVLRPETIVPAIESFLACLDRNQVTVINIPTPYWHELVLSLAEAHVSLPSSLRLVIIGNERLQSERLALWMQGINAKLPLIHAYGATETTITSLLYHVPPERKGQNSSELPIGKPIANTAVYLLDRRQQPVPIGVPGEIFIGGDGLARGYVNQMALTAERFVPHPFSQSPGARLYRTGDIGRWRPDGVVEFIGRVDEQVKVRGYRIELREVEEAVLEYTGVREAIVIAHEDQRGEKSLIAYLARNQHHFFIPTEMRSFLRERLPEYMMPSAFVLLDSLPRKPNGKVDRQALPEPKRQSLETGQTYHAPQTEVERVITAVWQEILRIEKVGTNENFFDLGGHSLLMVRVHSKLGQLLHKELSIVDMFRYPTVGSLGKYLSQKQAQTPFQHVLDRASRQKQAFERQRDLMNRKLKAHG
jgi:amino acid adenylation domain-containing protein